MVDIYNLVFFNNVKVAFCENKLFKTEQKLRISISSIGMKNKDRENS